jgi:hypothetical protein
MNMTKQERDLTIALGNEIAKNRKLTNMLNRVVNETWDWYNSGSEDFAMVASSYAKAIDKDLNPWDCSTFKFKYE